MKWCLLINEFLMVTGVRATYTFREIKVTVNISGQSWGNFCVQVPIADYVEDDKL